MPNRLALALRLLPALLASACTFIQPQPGSEQVLIARADAVRYCIKLGSTKVNALEKVGPFERNPTKLQANLEALARNSAVDMQGDTLVPASPVEHGQQTFDVYRCRH
jgi:hypothetical protein